MARHRFDSVRQNCKSPGPAAKAMSLEGAGLPARMGTLITLVATQIDPCALHDKERGVLSLCAHQLKLSFI